MVKFYKEETVVSRQTDKIVCNLCAKEIEKDLTGNFYDYIEINKEWGYLSDFDGQTHSFDLCEECYKKLISSFKYRPDIFQK